jgi:hypothetical protein
MNKQFKKLILPIVGAFALQIQPQLSAQDGSGGVPNQFAFECGMAVATCYSGSNTNAFVLGIVDTRNYLSAPVATNWYAPMYHGTPALPWNQSNLGGEVFGLALDGATPPHIFAAATSIYGNAGNGRVMRVDWVAGTISTFVNFANVGSIALGNIAYDKTHKQLFVADLDNGLIRRVQDLGVTGTEQLPAFNHGIAGRTALALSPIPDTSAPGVLTDSGRRVFGLQTFGSRLYYSVWSSPSTNEIWSVGLDALGDFIPVGINGPKIEIPAASLPAIPAGFDRAVTDIAFSENGRMLLGERTIYLNATTTLAGYAHYSLVREFELIGGVWTLVDQPEIGFYQPGNNIHANSAGGVDYDCSGGRYATGDALRLDSVAIYGLQILPPGVSNVTQSVLIDLDADITSGDKTAIGDVEVYRCCECMTLTDEKFECLPDGTRNYTFTVQNHFQSPISYLAFLSTTPGVTPASQLIPLPGPLTNGQSSTVTLPLNIPASVTQLCYRLAAHNDKFEECCSITNCVDVPKCCAIISDEKFQLDPATGGGIYSLCITNLTTNQVGYLYLLPDTNCISFGTNIVALSPPLAPNDGTCLTMPVTVSPNCTNGCFRIVMATTNFVECCTIEHCFPLRSPPHNEPPVVRCKQFEESCFPSQTPITVQIQVMDPEGDPLQVVLKVDGTPFQTNNITPPPAAYVPVTFNLVLPLGAHTLTYCVSDGYGPLVICKTIYNVGDLVPPVLHCPPDYKICGVQKYTIPFLIKLPGFSVSDNCSKTNEIKITQSPAPGTVVGQGTTCITLTATDAAGNTSTCQTCVTVKFICVDIDFLPTALVEGSDLPVHFQTADDTKVVTLFVDGEEVGRSATPPFEIKWTKMPGGIHTLWAQAQGSSGESELSDAVTVLVSPGKSTPIGPRLLPGTFNGQFGFSLQTLNGEKCYIEFTQSLSPSSWGVVEQTIGDGDAHFYGIQQRNLKSGFYRVRLDR